MINLYSLRWSSSRGWSWKLERECSIENANAWLEVFTTDEPDIQFTLASKLPKVDKSIKRCIRCL